MCPIVLTVPSEMARVPAAAASLRAECLARGIDPAHATTVELCVTEALNNAIEHAYAGASDKSVEVSMQIEAGLLTIEVRDSGRSIPSGKLDGAEILDPDPDDLLSLRERGMGLAILKSAMDTVTYRTEKGVNTLTLAKRVR